MNQIKKRIPLTQHAIAAKARSLFDKLNKKVETSHSLLAKDGLQGSSSARKFIA